MDLPGTHLVGVTDDSLCTHNIVCDVIICEACQKDLSENKNGFEFVFFPILYAKHPIAVIPHHQR